MSGRWGYPDTRKIYLVLWTFLFAFVMYRELLLLTRYMCKDRQKGLEGRGNFAARPETPTVRTPPHLLYPPWILFYPSAAPQVNLICRGLHILLCDVRGLSSLKQAMQTPFQRGSRLVLSIHIDRGSLSTNVVCPEEDCSPAVEMSAFDDEFVKPIRGW